MKVSSINTGDCRPDHDSTSSSSAEASKRHQSSLLLLILLASNLQVPAVIGSPSICLYIMSSPSTMLQSALDDMDYLHAGMDRSSSPDGMSFRYPSESEDSHSWSPNSLLRETGQEQPSTPPTESMPLFPSPG